MGSYKRNPVEEERSGEPVSQKKACLLDLVIAACSCCAKAGQRPGRSLVWVHSSRGACPIMEEKTGQQAGKAWWQIRELGSTA